MSSPYQVMARIMRSPNLAVSRAPMRKPALLRSTDGKLRDLRPGPVPLYSGEWGWLFRLKDRLSAGSQRGSASRSTR